MFPEPTTWVAQPRVAEKPVPCPGLLALLGGRQGMNGLGHRLRAVLGALAWLCWAVRSLSGRGPSPLKPFVAAGCSFLIPSFSPFTLSPDRKSPAPCPSQAGLGNRRVLEGILWGQSWRSGECTGVSGRQLGRRTGLPPYTLPWDFREALCFLGFGVLVCPMGKGGLVLTLSGFGCLKGLCWFLEWGMGRLKGALEWAEHRFWIGHGQQIQL